MSGYVLHLTEEENITLSGAVVRRLIDGGDGDAALVYLCLRRRGSETRETVCRQLNWDETRVCRAEETLSRLGLIGAPSAAPQPPPPAEPERPTYSAQDVAGKLERDEGFGTLLREVERKLGPLTTPAVGKLLGLYDDLGLGADVIFLLVNYCVSRKQEQFGAGRLPTMREIEKEGFAWARRELFSADAANRYLRQEQKRRGQYPAYLRALQMQEHPPVPGEERYLAAWLEMGFPPETVAAAYDKTVTNCHEFKWAYCNGILKRWHEKGLHTPEEVQRENAPKPQGRSSGGKKNDWMKKYI